MGKILQGVRVLDLSRFKSGPYCGQLLADMGAEVIRVEGPQGEEDRSMGPYSPQGESLYLLFTCRHKKGITLNLKTERGRELLTELVARADILLHNFTPQGAKALGVDYPRLREANPAIVVVAISGFGSYGPYSQKVCFDPIAQAMSGIMMLTGHPGGPPTKGGLNFIDMATGVYACLGAISALYHRQQRGEGQQVEVALLDVAASFLESSISEYKHLGILRPQMGNQNFLVAPSDAYRARDGYIYITVVGNDIWKRLLNVLGKEKLAEDPRYSGDWERALHREALEGMLQEWVGERTLDEVMSAMDKARIPCGVVRGIPEVAEDPHLKAREMLVEMEQPGVGAVTLIGNPVKFSSTPVEVAASPPALGEHNEEIYCGLLGLSRKALASLKEEGII